MNGPGVLVTPASGGSVPVAVGLIHAFEALRIPVGVYDTSLRCRQLEADGSLRQDEAMPTLRRELVDVLPRLRPAWILAIDDRPLDAKTVGRIRALLPSVRVAHWLVEAHDTVDWWASVGPLDDVLFSAEAGAFEQRSREAGIPFHWLPTACDEAAFGPGPATSRSGVGWAGTLRPDRAAFFSALAAAGLPLRLAGRGLAQIPALAPHAVHDGWVDASLERELYASSLVVPEFHAGAGHDIVGPRIFAAAGCGALVVTTPRERLQDLYPGDLIALMEPGGDWSETLARLLADPATPGRGARAAARTAAHHTYRHRAAAIVEALAKAR